MPKAGWRSLRLGGLFATAAAAVCLLFPAFSSAAPPVVRAQPLGSNNWIANCTVGSLTAQVQVHQYYDSFYGSYLADTGTVFAASNRTGQAVNAHVGFRQWEYDEGLDNPRFPPEMTSNGGSLDTNARHVSFETRNYDTDPPGYPDNDPWWAGYEDGLFYVYQVDEVEIDFDRNGSVDCIARFDWDPFIPLDPLQDRGLGDYLATGEGAGGYSGSCRRSPASYPARWAIYHPSVQFTSAACNNATTGSVLNSQVKSLDPAETDFVTVTVGANDFGLPLIVRQCATAGANCLPTIANAKTSIDNQLPSKLGAVYDAIHNRAPQAVVEAVAYPRLFGPKTCSATPNITLDEQKRLNGLIDEIDNITAYMAAASKVPKVHYIETRDAFASHELCSGSPWIRGGAVNSPESYNTNSTGQAALFLLLTAWTR